MDSDFSQTLVMYRGEDVAEEAQLLHDEYISNPKPLLPLTAVELQLFHTATTCHICTQLHGESARPLSHCGELYIYIFRIKLYFDYILMTIQVFFKSSTYHSIFLHLFSTFRYF